MKKLKIIVAKYGPNSLWNFLMISKA